MRGTRAIVSFAVLVAAAVPAGCGGGERQDENEPEGTYKVEIVDPTFPAKQTLAQGAELSLTVRNTDTKTIPNVSVTVDSFAKADAEPGLADPNRPVWIIDAGPKGGETAFTNTWALGSLAPGAATTFTWRVTAVQPGQHTVKYRVSAGLDGKAKAELADGGAPEGVFTVAIAKEPPVARVADDGSIVRTEK